MKALNLITALCMIIGERSIWCSQDTKQKNWLITLKKKFQRKALVEGSKKTLLFQKTYKEGDLEAIKALHKKHGVAFDAFIGEYQPIHLALKSDDASIVLFLLDQDISCTKKTLTKRKPTLSFFDYQSAQGNMTDDERALILRLLVQKGCNINETGIYDTAFAEYIRYRWKELTFDDLVIKEFITQGAVISHQEAWGSKAGGNIISVLLDAYQQRPFIGLLGLTQYNDTLSNNYDNQVYIVTKAVLCEHVKRIKAKYLTALLWLKKINMHQRKSKMSVLPKVIVSYVSNLIVEADAQALFDHIHHTMHQTQVRGWDLIPSAAERINDSKLSRLAKHTEFRHIIDAQSWRNDWIDFKAKKGNSSEENLIVQSFNKK